jgi:hypothetical protein
LKLATPDKWTGAHYPGHENWKYGCLKTQKSAKKRKGSLYLQENGNTQAVAEINFL